MRKRRRQPKPRTAAVHFVSLGCPKNLVDTELMSGQLGAAGYAIAADAEDADILVVNTCGFIQPACDEARVEIGRAVRWKKRRSRRRLVVAGCWVQRMGTRVLDEFPQIDLLLDLNAVPNVLDLVDALRNGGAACVSTAGLSGRRASVLADDTAPRLLLSKPGCAYLKIAEGCNHGCRFCTIPSIRGRQRSRTQDSLVREAASLLECGVRELNLIAQDTTRYGHDLADGSELASLVEALDRFEADYWIRLLYTHPAHFTERLVRTLAESRHAQPYIDIPLQHISEPVLERMGRRTPAADIRALLRRIRETIPAVTLRTTFLVGYPGETAADFATLLEFVEELKFERMGCFVFHPEPGTPAAELHRETPVPAPVAEQRRNRLMERQQIISLDLNRALVGQHIQVLIEGQRTDGTVQARSAMDAPDVDNCVILPAGTDADPASFCTVRVTDADAYELWATPA